MVITISLIRMELKLIELMDASKDLDYMSFTGVPLGDMTLGCRKDLLSK